MIGINISVDYILGVQLEYGLPDIS